MSEPSKTITARPASASSEDTARLDWLEENAASVSPILSEDLDESDAWYVMAYDKGNGESGGATLRAAIDAAHTLDFPKIGPATSPQEPTA